MTADLVPLSRVTLLLERTASDLAKVAHVTDAQDLVDRAAAIRDLSRRAKAGIDVENRVTALRVKAEMRLAQLVDEGQERGEIATAGDRANVRDPDISTLPDLGIDRQRLAEARTLNRYFSPVVVDGAADDATDLRTDEQRHTASFDRLLSALRDLGSQLERIDLSSDERDRVVGLLDGCRRRLGSPARLEVVREHVG
jgi:hypothetical protein